MKKVKLNIFLKNDGNEKKSSVSGIFNEKTNILTYSDAGIKHILKLNENQLIRENDEFIMKIDFKDNKQGIMTILYKELSMEIDVDISIIEVINSTNILSIKYIINDTENIEYTVEIIN